MNKQHIHFIGICGVAMSALAIAFHKKGWKVTGSDKGFFPPVSTHLRNEGVSYYPGWHPEKMTADGDPDLVVVGNVAGSSNPEWLYVQEKKLEYLSYPEALAKYFLKDKSIVCAGTYGKTTTSTLLSWILTDNGMDPSYMFGGLAINAMDAAHMGNGEYSVMEGDEYKSARWDKRPKFAHYSPTHLLLTAVIWDHADVYPTNELYFQAFRNLVASVPPTGQIIASVDGPNVMETLKHAHSDTPILTYGHTDTADYQYVNLSQRIGGLSFDIVRDSQTYHIKSPMIGRFMAENITACFAMAHTIGIAPDDIVKSIASFRGMKRRLEKRHSGASTVFDDIAHSPAKAAATLKNLREIYKGKIIAVFEPNTGNRRPQSSPGYDHAFDDADEVIIPRLTKLKIDPNDPDKPFSGPKLEDIIERTHDHVRCLEDDEVLVTYVASKVNRGDVVVFLGSHGFRGMIEELVARLRNKH